MRRMIYVLLIAGLLCLLRVPAGAEAAPGNSAASAILMHADTGSVLYEKNADERMLIASTTKIMTALVALKHCDPDETVRILPEYTGIEGSSMYLAPGDTYTLRELLYGLLLVSGNDAAVAIACHTAGSVAGFAALMNEEAARLGLANSSFKNPHGLDEEGHYSSARDLAIITAEALENPLFAEIIATKSYTTHGLTYVNHNKLLWNYDAALGGKTGYTSAAGRSLVSCAERDSLRLICVTLSDPDDWRDHSALCDWAFAHYRCEYYPAGTVMARLPVISGTADAVDIALKEDLRLAVPREKQISFSLRLPRFVFARVERGWRAGSAVFLMDGTTIAEVPLVYAHSVALSGAAPLKTWDRLQRMLDLAGRYMPYSYYCRV